MSRPASLESLDLTRDPEVIEGQVKGAPISVGAPFRVEMAPQDGLPQVAGLRLSPQPTHDESGR